MNNEDQTATYLGQAQGYWLGDARLYTLSKPIACVTRGKTTRHVIVHAIPGDEDRPGETIMLPACETGLLDTIAPIGGSPRRGIDHRLMLRVAGYELARKRD